MSLAACGGEDRRAEELPPGTGARLAAEAADVRQRVEAGDPLGANAEAQELHALAEEAIAAGEVPRALARELRTGVARVVAVTEAAIPPADPAPPAPAPAPRNDDEADADEDREEDAKGKGKQKGKAKGKGEERGQGNDDDDGGGAEEDDDGDD